MGLQRLALFLLGLLLCTGCLSRQNVEMDETEAVALFRTFFVDMLEADAPGIKAISSKPFWLDSWVSDQALLDSEFGKKQATSVPPIQKIVVRLYPVDDLAVLKPKLWETLKQTDAATLKELYLAAIAIYVQDKQTPESGFALVRRVDGRLRVAGLIEE